MYFGLTQSHLTYGIVLWGAASAVALNKLFIIQKKTIRAVFHKPFGSHTDPLFKSGQILKVYDLHKLECLKLFFRFTQKTLPPNLSKLFTLNSEIHAYGTRQASQIHRTNFTNAKFKENFLYQVAESWNSLSPCQRETSTWAKFSSDFQNSTTQNYI